MKKLVIKTILITLAFLISVTAIIFGVMSLVAPKHLAVFFDKMGGYEASINYYAKQYEKTGDIKDLALLCDKINKENDKERAERFLYKLTTDKGFYDFAKDSDEIHNINGDKNYTPAREYYLGEYALSLTKNDKLDQAFDVAENYIDRYGYTKYNPMRFIVSGYGVNCNDLVKLKKINNKIKSFYIINPEQNDYRNSDSDTIRHIIERLEKVNSK